MARHGPAPSPLHGLASPLQGEEFERLMAPFAPFENAPHLAVAVSGGADSMALCLLADFWARSCHGSITALTVDHGLRAASAAEGRQVAGWCRARNIAHRTLRWAGPKPATGIEAAAREARHRLLAQWSARHAVLHLLLAHHRDDQAETVAIRTDRSSGADGLAGMAAVVERAELRLLRPLLAVPPSRIRATLVVAGQGWIEDPMNRDPAFARARLRLEGRIRGREAIRLAATARRNGIARAARDTKVAELLARSAAFEASGRIAADIAAIVRADPEIGRRALARMLLAVGGGTYSPRAARLERLYRALRDGGIVRTRTLGGCLVAVADGRLVVSREGPRRTGPSRRAGETAHPLAPPRFGVV